MCAVLSKRRFKFAERDRIAALVGKNRRRIDSQSTPGLGLLAATVSIITNVVLVGGGVQSRIVSRTPLRSCRLDSRRPA